jgi:hypothetical protein
VLEKFAADNIVLTCAFQRYVTSLSVSTNLFWYVAAAVGYKTESPSATTISLGTTVHSKATRLAAHFTSIVKSNTLCVHFEREIHSNLYTA